MNKSFLVRSALIGSSCVSLLLPAWAINVEPADNIALSSSTKKQKTSFVLSEPPADLEKKAKVKMTISGHPGVKVKPKQVAFKQLKDGSIKSSQAIFVLKKFADDNLGDDDQMTALITFTPNKQAAASGIETSNATILISDLETDGFPIELNFSGQSLLPQTNTSSSRVRRVLTELVAGEPTAFKIPANAGSCALGLGGSALSTSTGPGTEGVNRIGTGTDGDPLYIIFNNPDNGGENQDFSLNSIPATLLDTPLTGFAQYYEGRYATGQVMATVTGSVTVDTESERFDLTTDDGVVVSFFKDGSKEVTVPEELSALASDAGLDLASGKAFLEGASLQISIPEAEMEADITSGIEQGASGASNISVDLTGDMTGTLTLDVNKLNGEFKASGTISFDSDGETITLSGTDNVRMTIESDRPATLSGSTLQNARGTIVMSGGTGPVLSITADFVINNADVSIDEGITSTDITITNVMTDLNPDFGNDQGQGGDDGSGDSAYEQCLSQCAEQGGDAETCSTNCADFAE